MLVVLVVVLLIFRDLSAVSFLDVIEPNFKSGFGNLSKESGHSEIFTRRVVIVRLTSRTELTCLHVEFVIFIEMVCPAWGLGYLDCFFKNAVKVMIAFDIKLSMYGLDDGEVKMIKSLFKDEYKIDLGGL